MLLSRRAMIQFNLIQFFLRILAGIFLFSLPTGVLATPPVMLEEVQTRYPLGLHLDVLEDKEGKWSIDDILSPEIAAQFKASEEKMPGFGFMQSVYWVRFQVDPGNIPPKNWLLELSYPLIDYVTLYSPQTDGGFSSRQSGDRLPYHKREIDHHHFIFNLSIQGKQTYYLSFKTEGSMKLPLILWDEEAFENNVRTEQMILGIYYGVFLTMVLFNALLFVSTGNRNYFYFVCFYIIFILAHMTFTGLSFRFLWPENIWLANRGLPLIAGIAAIIGPIYAHSILEIKTRLPQYHNLLYLHCSIGFALILSALFAPYIFSVHLLFFGLIFITGVIFSIHIKLFFLKIRQAVLHFIAFSALHISLIITTLNSVNILPDHLFTTYSIYFGVSLQAILSSLALADQINFEKKRKEQLASEVINKNRILTQEIDQRKTVESELEEYKENLIDLVEQRTGELRDANQQLEFQQQELLEAKNQAELANQAKTQFLANISHEIRTPLGAIKGFNQILINKGKELSLPETFQKFQENINSNVNILSDLINSVLDLSKIEAGGFEIVEEDFNLNDLMNGLFNTYKFQADQKGVLFSYEIDPNLPTTIRLDRTKLTQILTNLIGNAIKFTEAGQEVNVTVTGDNGVISFMVTDKGIGIPRDRQQIIFDTFEQADGSTTRQFGGTGLGLAISKKLTEMMGGKILLTSQLGKGSVFNLILPLNTTTLLTKSQSPTSERTLPIPQGNVILVIEDNLMNQTLIGALLEDFSLDTHFANNGAEGIDKTWALKAQGKLPDLIFMDIQMPVMGGIEATKRIRQNPEFKNIPIVALSADAFTEQQQQAFDTGVDDYLTKPIDDTKLREVLEKYLCKIQTSN